MKKTTLALAISAATLAATPALATNGDHLIGLGAKSRALGGTGIAAFYGAENALINPALLAKGKTNELTFAGTIFKPTVKVKQTNVVSNAPLPPGAFQTVETSDADLSVIPEVAIMNPINEQLVFGIGIFGVAGMGVDFRDNPNLNNARTNLQLMKFAPSLAYNGGNWGVGASVAVMYGSLDIAYKLYDINNTPYVNPVSGTAQQGGTGGVSDDYGLGWQIGGYFDVTDSLTLGATYQSPITLKYKGQIASAAADFNLGSRISSDKLEQPATLGVGVSYSTGAYELTVDFKQIKWGDATGYKEFGWEDQNVIALGARYQGNGYWVGIGFNKGDNPIKKNPTGNPQLDGALNRLNYLMFPGTVEKHWTLGGGYRFSKTFSVDVALTYAPEVKDTVTNGFAMDANNNPADGPEVQGQFDLITKHSQVGYTLSLHYDF